MTCNSVLSGEAMPLFASGRNLCNRSWRTGQLHLYLDSSQPLGHEVIQKRADRTEDETQDTIEDLREKSKNHPTTCSEEHIFTTGHVTHQTGKQDKQHQATTHH